MNEEPDLEAQSPLWEGEPREIHLWQYWAVVVKWRLLIGVVTGLALVTTLLIAFLSRPLYLATTTMNMEPDRGSVLDIGTGGPMWQMYNPEFLPTQTLLIANREVARKTVEKLNLLQNPILNPRKSGMAKAAAGSVGGTPIGAEEEATQLAILIQGGLSAKPRRGTNLVDVSFASPNPKLSADVANAVAASYIEWTLESKYRILAQASQFLSTQIEQLRAEIDEKEAKLQAYGRQKDIVSEDPQADVTMQKLAMLNRDYASAVADRVSKESRYYEIQGAPPESIADPLSGGLVSQLRNEQMKAERDYAEKTHLYKPEWPAMEQLKVQIEKGRENLKQVIQETVAKAREQAKADFQMAVRREEALKNVLSQQKTEAMDQGANAVEYNNLLIEVATKRSLRDALMKRQSETEMTSRLHGGGEASIRIVEPALVPGSPFTPNYKRTALMGLAAGLFLGVGLAFLIEYLDRSIRTAEQVEDLLRLPALGIIPAIGPRGTVPRALQRLYYYSRKDRGGGAYSYAIGYGYGGALGKKPPKGADTTESTESGEIPAAPKQIELMPHRHPRSVVAEAYRTLRNALLLSRAGGVKTIVVTSALQGEGKTATAVNLAVVLGQLGKKVLLVDGDLHRQRIHEVLRMPNRVGLVTILTDATVRGKDAIQASGVPNVAVLTGGPSSPNPSALVSSEGMARILRAARETFDYVVIDSPPVLVVSDSMLLSHEADGVVLCVRAGDTPREEVIRARDRLVRSGSNLLGVVLNGFGEGGGMEGDGGTPYGYPDAKERVDAEVPAGAVDPA